MQKRVVIFEGLGVHSISALPETWNGLESGGEISYIKRYVGYLKRLEYIQVLFCPGLEPREHF